MLHGTSLPTGYLQRDRLESKTWQWPFRLEFDSMLPTYTLPPVDLLELNYDEKQGR